ncbi:MAG: 16S rRNA (uracil(1498)-N(3))-methyltransferase [Deltaproteobacteria bacterium]|nr:16S rRNA (uracil(1498)-N(3))-methyltransferase [Deltaproteobacteria bacterium]
MTTPRIYVPSEPDDKHRIALRNDHLNYIKNVLRLKPGDPVTVFDGRRFEYETVIEAYVSDAVILEIVARKDIRRPELRITLAQSIPKAGKMEYIIQKATELGVTTIIPVITERSVPKFTPSKMEAKVSRWRKIAVEASRQCGRAVIPEIRAIVPFDTVVTMAEEQDCRIILWEEEASLGLKALLHERTNDPGDGYFFIVGPEGGLTRGEVASARSHGFVSVSLGTYILRTETVGLAVLSILQYERGIFCTPATGEQGNE